jgi:Beta-propeller repeat
LSKLGTSRGWACTFSIVPVLAIIAIALLVLSPAAHRGGAGTASAVPFASQSGAVPPAARSRIQASYAALPLAFEQNKGQTDAQVKYMARGNGYTLFLTANDAVFALHSQSDASESSIARRESFPRESELRAKNPLQQRNARKDSTAVVRMQLVGANSPAQVSASGQLPGKSNYFLGNDPSKWRRDVAHYARVNYQDVYPGVNLAFHGAQRQLEFDFVVAPLANPAPIGFRFTGAQGMKTDGSGNLIISSTAGDVLLHKPVAFQEKNGARQTVDARFALKADNQVSLELGNYDRSRELVIDPSVSYAYSTYLGGSGDDAGFGIAFDNYGNTYVTGETTSQNFPGASNKLTGTANVFVVKIAADGSSLIYSTYIGGTGTNGDSGNAIAVNQTTGDAFVAGGTSSTNFPTTNGVFQTALGSGAVSNAFVFELNPGGSTLTYSTYLGGSDDDVANGIAVDSSGNAYIAGLTSSSDFPTLNPLQTYPGTTHNGFVTKLNSSGTALVYSTYLALGGVAGDSVNAIALDLSDNAYVTGVTSGTGFYTTSGAFQTTCGCSDGTTNAFVTVINAAETGYVYSTFLGGSGSDAGDGIAVDSSGSAYVTGDTESSNFPLMSALQPTYGGATDAFVTKFNPTGSALVYSTYLGGSEFDAGASIAIDGGDNAYITGETDSTGSAPFPTTVGATQPTIGGGYDAFVSEINSTGSALAFSTYLGGSGNEDVGGDYGAIAVDSPGDAIYVTGNTASSNFPATTGAYQTANAGGNDAFVVKYAQPAFTISASTPAAVNPGASATSTVTLTALNGYSLPVNLSCNVSGGTSPSVGCSVTGTNPQTPTASGATSTVTITTIGTSGALFHPRKLFYAMWLPIAGLSLMGMGFGSSRSRRKKLLGFLMIGMVMAALFLMPACGGGSSTTTTSGCPGCTSPGNYNVTITGTDANNRSQSTQITLTVN